MNYATADVSERGERQSVTGLRKKLGVPGSHMSCYHSSLSTGGHMMVIRCWCSRIVKNIFEINIVHNE